ncbi:MAG: hypothetical protein P8X74_20390 [Reinekea sp.]
MLPKNFNEPMGAPAIFEKQIEIKLLHSASTKESRIQAISTGKNESETDEPNASCTSFISHSGVVAD